MNKIGWCDMTWNPVIGCRNNCEYCYARKINDRFKFIKNWNEPEWREKSFSRKLPIKPQRIFVGSMSEIYYWDLLQTYKVLNKVKEYPQHTFQFLTKFSDTYMGWNFPDNCWLGVTITKEENFKKGIPYDYILSNNITFLSIEPILEAIDPSLFDNLNLNWIIIGAETGNRKGKVIPKREWIEDIINYCKDNNIPIYLKDSLRKIYPSWVKWIKEFPEVMV